MTSTCQGTFLSHFWAIARGNHPLHPQKSCQTFLLGKFPYSTRLEKPWKLFVYSLRWHHQMSLRFWQSAKQSPSQTSRKHLKSIREENVLYQKVSAQQQSQRIRIREHLRLSAPLSTRCLQFRNTPRNKAGQVTFAVSRYLHEHFSTLRHVNGTEGIANGDEGGEHRNVELSLLIWRQRCENHRIGPERGKTLHVCCGMGTLDPPQFEFFRKNYRTWRTLVVHKKSSLFPLSLKL